MDQRIAAQKNRDDNSMENLCFNLLQFLSRALQDARTSYATERAKSPLVDSIQIIDECDEMVFATFEAWCRRNDDKQQFFDEPALLKHKQVFDLMQCNKEGDAKEDHFCHWCRKMAWLRMQATSTATEHAKSSTATECAQFSEDPETRWYKVLALDLLSNELLPEQQGIKKYQIRRDRKTGEIQVTGKQRSWINCMLRKNLGNAKAAFFIFNHGIPELFDAPLRKTPPSEAQLQSMLEDAMHWYASMLQSIVEHEDHPDMECARKLACLDQDAWRRRRQETKRDAKQRLSQGSRLAMDRDTKKRKYEDMSARERQILEDFDTRKSRKRHNEACVTRLPPFRGSLRKAVA